MATLPTIYAAAPQLLVSDYPTSSSGSLLFTSGATNEVLSRGAMGALTATDSFDSSGQVGTFGIYGRYFKPDGTKFWLSGLNSVVYEYTMSTAWDLTTAAYANKTHTFSYPSSTSVGISFSSDGTKIFVLHADDVITQYTMSTAWDITTAGSSTGSYTATASINSGGFVFKPDGTAFYVWNTVATTYEILQYACSTAWDITTASYTTGFDTGYISPIEGAFSSDGTKMYLVESSHIRQYALSTAWNVSTATLTKSVPITQLVESGNIATSSDGTKMYLIGTDKVVYEVALPTAYDIQSATPPVPSSFLSMDALSYTIEYRQSGRSDDTIALDIRLMSGTTVLAAADGTGTYEVVNADVTSTTDVTTGPTAFAYVNTGATKAQWEAATIDFRQRITASMANDGARIGIDYVALTGTYTSAGTTLVVADAAHGHTADATGELTQIVVGYSMGYTAGYIGRNLTPSDVAHAHAVDALDLVQQHSVVVADAAHAHAADAVTLTQLHVLTIAEISHAHTVEAVLLTQIHALVVVDAAHEHAVEAITLSQIHELALVDAFHAHAVEAVLVSQDHTLVGLVDVGHTHSVDNASVLVVTISHLWADAHLTGTVDSPANALGATDGSWTSDAGVSWDSRFSMENPPVGAVLNGTQTITIPVRKDGGSGTPTITVELWENGVFVKTLVLNQAVT